MGTLAGSVLISRARRLLRDETSAVERWSDAVLLDALNEGQLALCGIKPDTVTTVATHDITAGSRQAIPSDGLSFIKVIKNANGYAPLPATESEMSGMVPSWHSMTGAAVERYIFDDIDNKAFYIFPTVTPSPGVATIEVMYGAKPTDLAADTDSITVPDEYAPALVNFMCHRALMEDMRDATNRTVANSYYEHFVALVAGKAQGETQQSPNTRGASAPA